MALATGWGPQPKVLVMLVTAQGSLLGAANFPAPWVPLISNRNKVSLTELPLTSLSNREVSLHSVKFQCHQVIIFKHSLLAWNLGFVIHGSIRRGSELPSMHQNPGSSPCGTHLAPDISTQNQGKQDPIGHTGYNYHRYVEIDSSWDSHHESIWICIHDPVGGFSK